MDAIKPTDDQLEALRTEHGDVFTVDFEDHQVVFKRPSVAAYKRFQVTAYKKEETAKAAEDLSVDTIVFPAKDDLKKLVEVFPGVPEVVGLEGAKVARGAASDRAKKVTTPT